MLVAHFATQDDKLTPDRALGLVAGFIGVVVLIGPDLLSELGAHVLGAVRAARGGVASTRSARSMRGGCAATSR